MRFKKGTKVEILSEKDLPSRSWRRGVIVSGDDHSYTVRYVVNGYDNEEVVVERVSTKVIRPCPPLPKVSGNWAPGDVVEAFHGCCWRMASISKVLCNGYYVVRLLGSYMEFEASKSEIRTRQSWEDDKWAVIGKSSWNCVQTSGMRGDVLVKDNLYGGKESKIISCSTSKRRGSSYAEAETFCGLAKRFRKTYYEGNLYPEVAAEEYQHSSLDNITDYCEVELEKRSVGSVDRSSAMSLDPDTVRCITSSVGSCSVSGDDSHKWYSHVHYAREVDEHCSDAESFCQREHDEGSRAFLAKEELAAEVHRLELDAYRCTIVALHASGPLSWDQEAMMTNLRLSLHISNDEHLMEVRSLISASNNSIRSR